MNLKILVTAGDGIGPEVTNEAVAVLQGSCRTRRPHALASMHKRIGGVAIVQDGTPLPADTLAAALDSDAVLLGAVGGNEFNSLSPDKRPEAGLLANSRRARRLCQPAPLPSRSRNSPSTARCAPKSSTAPTSSSSANCSAASTSASPASGIRPPAKPRTPCATRATKSPAWPASPSSWRRSAAKKLTSVDKANVLEVSQLWRATVTEVAAEFPDVTLEHQYVDAMAMHMMNSRATSTWSSPRISSATFSPTSPPSSPARSACCPRPPSAARSTSTSRSTAPRPTSPARAWPIRSAQSSPAR